MAVTKTAAEIATAVATVSDVIKARNSGDAGALRDAAAVFARVVDQYTRETTVDTVTASGADAAAFFTAASIADGDVFKVAGTQDTDDDALETAKGSPPAAGDVFQRVTTAVVYVGPAAGIAYDSSFYE
jgi:hypothetical protein